MSLSLDHLLLGALPDVEVADVASVHAVVHEDHPVIHHRAEDQRAEDGVGVLGATPRRQWTEDIKLAAVVCRDRSGHRGARI